jgi:hypothetical protein
MLRPVVLLLCAGCLMSGRVCRIRLTMILV